MTRELRALRVERALHSTLQSATAYKKQLKDHMAASANSYALVQEGIFAEINDAWLRHFKIAEASELIGLPIMDIFEPESRAALKGALVATIAGKWQKGDKLIVKAHIDSGEAEEMHLELRRIDLEDGPMVQIRIAPQLKVAEEPTKLVHDALKRDPTMLFFHRAQFLERVSKRLKRRPDSGTHCLVYLKPDNFREVRDKVGIINSEEILAQFAEFVRKRMHPRDVAGRFDGTSIMLLLAMPSAVRRALRRCGPPSMTVGPASAPALASRTPSSIAARTRTRPRTGTPGNSNSTRSGSGISSRRSWKIASSLRNYRLPDCAATRSRCTTCSCA